MSLTDIRVANKSLPIARYVYLVQDASDSIRMGGVPGNTYTTFQAAYDAANTLQLALGGTNRVVIMVGNTTAAAVGDVILTANWNESVWVEGISFLESEVGNITGDNAAGAGFSVGRALISQQVGFSKVKVGNISVSATGAASNSGTIGIAGANAWFGNLNTNITNAANTTGNGGAIRFTFNTNNSHLIIGNINTSSQDPASSAGLLTINAATVSIGTIVTSNNNSGGPITITPSAGGTISSITVNSTGSSANLTLKRCTTAAASSIAFINNAASFVDCDLVDFTITDPSGSSTATFTRTNVEDYTSNAAVTTNSFNSLFRTITSLGDNSILSSSAVNTRGVASPCIDGIGTGCLLKNTSLVGGTLSIDNGAAVTVDSDTGVFDSPLGSNVTINLNGGVPVIADSGAGVFTFDASVSDSGSIDLTGLGPGGLNTLNIVNAAVGGKYIIYVTNATGTDTLAITGSAIEGGAYVPTAVAGAVDMLEITYEAPVYNLFFVRPFMNFS
jgi:hypothetical protein